MKVEIVERESQRESWIRATSKAVAVVEAAAGSGCGGGSDSGCGGDSGGKWLVVETAWWWCSGWW